AGAPSEPGTGWVHRKEVRKRIRAGDQPGEDPSSGSEGAGGESGLSGIHVPVRPRSERARSEVLEYVSVGEGPEEGAGQAARHDGCPSMFQAHTATDRGDEPASEGMGELLLYRVSSGGLAGDQHVRARPSRATPETAQPAALPTAGRGDLL